MIVTQSNDRLCEMISLSDSLAVPVFIVEVRPDETFVFRTLNGAHERTTGLSSAAVEGKTPYDVLPKRTADAVAQKYLSCVRSRQPYSYEEVLALPRGEMYWHTTLSPITNGERIIGLFGSAIDITDLKRREIHNAQLIADLRRLNEEVNTYTSIAAHDVRGPLRKIRVISELFFANESKPPRRTEGLRHEQRDLVETIGEIAAQSLTQVDNILSYTRALSLEAKADVEHIDVGLMVADLLGLIDPDGDAEIDYPKVVIEAERTVLQIVLRNLIENALIHGGSACHVDLAPLQGDPAQLKLTVSDNGEGFGDATDLDALSAAARARSHTSGFGLAGAKSMIETGNGEIWMERSHFGKGAAVAFTIQGALIGTSMSPGAMGQS